MTTPVKLYGSDLLGNAYKQKLIRHLNNAPGGEGGVDGDVQYRLGAKGATAILDRAHGICCGITIAWIVGFVNGLEEARQCTLFEDYFRDVLRFQGAYLKDAKGNIGGLEILDKACAHKCDSIGRNLCLLPHELAARIPRISVWAGYLGIYHHAIGIGYSGKRYFIMEPNAGLFKYKKGDVNLFIIDLQNLIEARRRRKGVMGLGNTIQAWFYTKKN